MPTHPHPADLTDPAAPTHPVEHQVLNPATEEHLATVPGLTPQDVDAVVRRAAAAQPRWAA
ncbi:aldehyde dehydrogenase family protein, partial [Streptomyces sparsus]